VNVPVHRRRPHEFSDGRDWTDAQGNRGETSWIQDSGELYVITQADASNRKFGVSSRAAAVPRARKLGLLDDERLGSGRVGD
jgi:hypothetical protein